MAYTYPPAPAQVVGGTALQIDQALKNPNTLARRLYDITKENFISDFLLTERVEAVGGAIILPNGDEIEYMDDEPGEIAPGAEFPLSKTSEGTFQMVRSTKWGLDTDLTDESISRRKINALNRSLQKVGNTIVRYVDGIGLAVIASRITSDPDNSVEASGTWVGDGTESGDLAAGKRIVKDVLRIKAQRQKDNAGFGYDYDTVVLDPVQHSLVLSTFINGGRLPQESNNPLETGVVRGVLGLNWVTSNHVPFTDPFFVDRAQLGGIATENIESPGYGRFVPYPGAIAIESKAIRDDDNDKWKVRGRRVQVPYVLDAKAGFRITGTGL